MHPNSELRAAVQLEQLADSPPKDMQAENSLVMGQATDDFITLESPIGSATQSGLRQVLTTVVLLAAVAVAGWLVTKTGIDETSHPDWAHVNAAANASADSGADLLVRRDSNGATSPVTVIQLQTADLDVDTTNAVRAALIRGDLVRANQTLSDRFFQATGSSQKTAANAKSPNLDTTPDLIEPLKNGRSKFFHLHMRDCCHEDGDVVQIDVNGQPYTIIPLTHAGATISVPLSSGITTLTLRGIKDGRGGITIQFSTSQGDYFARTMEVGEEYHIGVAAP